VTSGWRLSDPWSEPDGSCGFALASIQYENTPTLVCSPLGNGLTGLGSRHERGTKWTFLVGSGMAAFGTQQVESCPWRELDAANRCRRVLIAQSGLRV
jgi:hypothetical protein